ncbi:hypothetical protein LguiB_017719 [Lonicera macranthoides]
MRRTGRRELDDDDRAVEMREGRIASSPPLVVDPLKEKAMKSYATVVKSADPEFSPLQECRSSLLGLIFNPKSWSSILTEDVCHSVVNYRGMVKQERGGGMKQVNQLEQQVVRTGIDGGVGDMIQHVDQIGEHSFGGKVSSAIALKECGLVMSTKWSERVEEEQEFLHSVSASVLSCNEGTGSDKEHYDGGLNCCFRYDIGSVFKNKKHMQQLDSDRIRVALDDCGLMHVPTQRPFFTWATIFKQPYRRVERQLDRALFSPCWMDKWPHSSCFDYFKAVKKRLIGWKKQTFGDIHKAVELASTGLKQVRDTISSLRALLQLLNDESIAYGKLEVTLSGLQAIENMVIGHHQSLYTSLQ